MAANRGVITATGRSSRFGRSRPSPSSLGATIQQTDMVADCGPEDVIRWPSSSPLSGAPSSECCADYYSEELLVGEKMHRLQRRRRAPRLFISDKVITGRKRAAQRRSSSLCDCLKEAIRFPHSSSWLVTVLLCTYLLLSSHCGVAEASRQDGE